MFKRRKVIAIIPAAGSGRRMKGTVKKQYMQIGGKPILAHTISKYQDNSLVDEIIIAIPEADRLQCEKEIIRYYAFDKVKKIVPGGRERQESVWHALENLAGEEPETIVLVHDGVRPFVEESLIDEIVEQAYLNRAVIAGVPVKDTVKRVENGLVKETVERENLYAIQTPQAFEYQLLFDAYREAGRSGFSATDDAGVVEAFGSGVGVKLISGDYNNIKITTEEDLKMGAYILEEKSSGGGFRIGTGYDVHQLVEGRALVLGGVEIPHLKGLLGHSDADVLLHAIMDAVLGAMALGDIGKHFSDQDAQYKDISSLELLSQVKKLVEENACEIQNIDATIVAQAPRLAGYIEEMRKNIAETLGVAMQCVSVKATTTEKLGFEGEEKGISAQAVALLSKR